MKFPPFWFIFDVVRLRSGGPKMTVCRADCTSEVVDVRWINNELKMETVNLPPAALRKVYPDEA